MDKMHGMRCAADVLTCILILLDLIGAAMVVLMFRRRFVARWPLSRWAPRLMCRLCGIPYGGNLGDIRKGMFDRYSIPGNDRRADAVAYADRVIDRQINKARGILPFNSILIAALSLENRSGVDPAILRILEYIAYPIFAGLFISSLLLLELFWVHWGGSSDYGSFDREFTSSLVMARDRSILLDMSIILSIFCVLGLLLAVVGLPVVRWIYWSVGLRGSLGVGVCWR